MKIQATRVSLQASKEAADWSRRWRLPAAWREPFESSFGCGLGHVTAASGPDVERRLAVAGAGALAVDAKTILLSERLLSLPEPARLLAVGHELAHTLQLARGGSAAPELLEAEAWQAARAALAGRRRPIRLGGAGPLAIPAYAILLTEAANLYYKGCKKCSVNQGRAYLEIAAGDRVVLKPMIFESLLDTMIAQKKHRRFVLFTHGTYDGMLMPLTARHVRANEEFGTVQPRSHILLMLMQIDELFTDLKAAQDADAQAEQLRQSGAAPEKVTAASSAARQKWQALVRKIGADAGTPGPEAVQQWLNLRLQILHMSEKEVRALLDKRHQLQDRKLERLEIRSCFIGSKRHSLQVLRRFFGAEVVGAPTEFSAFGYLDVVGKGGSIGRAAYQKFSREHPDARKYTDQNGLTKGKVALAYKLKNTHEADTYAAATSETAMREWIDKFFDGPSRPPLNNIPVHFLAIDAAPPGVPGIRDQEYWAHIAYAAPLDSDDLPASLFTAGAAQP
jgi:hypothetical protein